MSTLLLKRADLLVTMDDQERAIPHGGLLVRDGVIEWVGPMDDLPPEQSAAVDRTIDARGMIVLPGLVNCHHHLYQTLTRAVPDAQDVPLFKWLKVLYGIWAGLTPEAIHVSALVGLAELIWTLWRAVRGKRRPVLFEE